MRSRAAYTTTALALLASTTPFLIISPATTTDTVTADPQLVHPVMFEATDHVLAEVETARRRAASRPVRSTPAALPPATAAAKAVAKARPGKPAASTAPAVKKKKVPTGKKRAPERAVRAGAPRGGAASAVVAYALAQVGKPYRFATAGPHTFDCSGLAKAAYAQVGVSVPHQTGSIIGRGRGVGRSELAAGDLVFPSSGHVGIYIGDGRMVHAPKPGDKVKVSGVYSFWAARRLL